MTLKRRLPLVLKPANPKKPKASQKAPPAVAATAVAATAVVASESKTDGSSEPKFEDTKAELIGAHTSEGTRYDWVFGKWAKCEDHTLLYVGAGWDMSFPLHRRNVLIDQLPGYPYYGESMNGYPNAAHMRECIQWQLQAIFPDDLSFEEDKVKKRWCWTSVERDVTIIYYHSFKYHFPPKTPQNAELQKLYANQVLPPEALEADVLYVEGLHPRGIDYLLPKLAYFQLGNSTMPWKPSVDLRPPPAPKLNVSKRRSQFLKRMCDMLNALWRMRLNLRGPKQPKVCAKISLFVE
jgi:hypothetical protein